MLQFEEQHQAAAAAAENIFWAENMNSDEVQVIKKTWEIPVATPTDSGAAILTTFFNRYPSNLEKFPFRDVPLEELAVCIIKWNDLRVN